ncbi:DEAD/DEAH box helicase [Bauldia litoralis]|uniref:DEAD/DEAH box helicase n=1 Tax=Bauldia litoralis TaxID=665467 RepID=UPI0032645E82
MSFNALGLAEPISRALSEAGYTTPTPIQAQAIPVVLSGRDLIGIAQTGTGKTAAFALPILNKLAAAPKPLTPKSARVLVLSPTRELSGQIVESFTAYGKHLRLSVRLAIGGVPIRKQIRNLSGGVDVLVATPGRLLDLAKSRAVKLDEVEYLVLDEADRMLDMGFIHDIRRLVAMLPKDRQTLFFSATMPPEIARLAGDMLTDPAQVSVTPPSSTVSKIEQRVYHIGRADKPNRLAELLVEEPINRALVFTRTKHGADRVVRVLAKAGIGADAIHGNKSQGQRERALAKFRSGSVTTLIATDIAARGIDVAGITHVINYDLPEVPETYVHRIGRTARAGNTGIAISLCSPDETPLLKSIERLIKVDIASTGHRVEPRGAAPDKAKPQRASRNRNRRRGGNGGQRPQRQPHRGDDIGAVAFLRDSNRPAADPTS